MRTVTKILTAVLAMALVAQGAIPTLPMDDALKVFLALAVSMIVVGCGAFLGPTAAEALLSPTKDED